MRYDRWDVKRAAAWKTASLCGAGLDYPLALVLASRDACDPASARRFLTVSSSLLADPFALPGMREAVSRFDTALRGGEKIAVYGDYDADGVTACALLHKYITAAGGDCVCYIPDRFTEGYGMNNAAVEKIAAAGVSLIVTADTGIAADEQTERARALGMDVIVTDHHECSRPCPGAVASVNPRLPGGEARLSCLAGVGVAFYLLRAHGGDTDGLLERYGELVAIGTVADIMPMTDDNKTLVNIGLEKLGRTDMPGLAALMREAEVCGDRLTAQTVSFKLAPLINAAGRMSGAQKALALLLTRDEHEAQSLARELSVCNRQRQSLENEVFLAADAILARNGGVAAHGADWHPGVVGIVASRLAARHNKPVFLLAGGGDGVVRGSARGSDGFSLTAALAAHSRLLLSHGGHEKAAGFTLEPRDVEAFTQSINEYCKGYARPEKVLAVDAELSPGEVTLRAVKSLERLEPYGRGNEQPVFMFSRAKLTDIRPMGQDKHSRLCVGGHPAVWFGEKRSDIPFADGDTADCAFRLSVNSFGGRENVQLQLLDLRQSAAEGGCA
ncbi:MAG: single-stranded-DNA-specific exonuclease RecJ [Oscillospiraceae bacterium]|jgi:single-stranded-DNA-specific exonuclease|nr:single-stranded-DNA-specific exonuclease RecJ [Oscillospiraceae bacterium]